MKTHLRKEQAGFRTNEGDMWPLALLEGVSAIRIDMPKWLDVHRHSHGRDCILIVLQGSVEFDDGQKMVLQTGDVATYFGHESIGFRALEQSSVLFISLGSDHGDMNGLISMFEKLGLERLTSVRSAV